MARFEGGHKQAEIREDWRKEANHTHQGIVRRLPRCALLLLLPACVSHCTDLSEEFGIYLNYVRKLGFEETPDYDFLRELFTKVMKNNNDVDDGVFDWNLLNGRFALASLVIISQPCHQIQRAGKQRW